MYLHENRDVFRNLVANAAQYVGTENTIVEKDYYVTLILRMLAEKHDNCVFKGGTSLSKGFHLINRFSEDVDITFDEHLGNKRRGKLKHETMRTISERLVHRPKSNYVDCDTYFFESAGQKTTA